MSDLTKLKRTELVHYIEELEAKVETLSAQLELLNADFGDIEVPEPDAMPELNVSSATSDALAEAAALFGGDTPAEEPELPVVEPAPVENGVVKLDPVTAEDYIPVAAPKVVKVRVRRK